MKIELMPGDEHNNIIIEREDHGYYKVTMRMPSLGWSGAGEYYIDAGMATRLIAALRAVLEVDGAGGGLGRKPTP